MKCAFWIQLLWGCALAVICASDSIDRLKYKGAWRKCAMKDHFLTIMNIPIKTCVSECEVRTACRAVNYWSVHRRCDLLSDDTPGAPHPDNQQQPCVYIRKTDVQNPAASPLPATCSTCPTETACDVTDGQCYIKECRRLSIPNAKIKGNRLSVGSKVMIYCDMWFYQQPNVSQSVCLDNGTWDNVPSCEYMFGCQIPPNLPHAEAYDTQIDTVTSDLVVLYRCDVGYENHDVNAAMNLTCGTSQMWAEPDFQCLRNCGEPPDVENATLSAGGILENMTRIYTCLPGHVVNGTTSTTTITTCQADGNWTSVDVECVPADTTTTTPTTTSTTTSTTTEPTTTSTTTSTTTTPTTTLTTTTPTTTSTTTSTTTTPTTTSTTTSTTTTPTTTSTTTTPTTTSTTTTPTTTSTTTTPTTTSTTTTPTTTSTTTTPTTTSTTTTPTATTAAATTTTTVATTTLSASCPSGWLHMGNSCYFVTGTVTRMDAWMGSCQMVHPGSHMLQLETEAEDVMIRDYLQQTYEPESWCLGLIDWNHDNVWRWVTTNDTIVYNYWDPNEPGGGQYFAIIYIDNDWHDAPNNWNCKHVCELADSTAIPTTTPTASVSATTVAKTTTTILPANCPSGWLHMGDSCYFVTGTEPRLDASLGACEMIYPGSHMLQLETAEEDVMIRDYLYAAYGPQSWCLGLIDWNHDDVWRWVTTNDTIVYDFWDPGEPDGGQYFAIIYTDNDLHDAPNYFKCKQVCEIG